jgi:hypothetical protein
LRLAFILVSCLLAQACVSPAARPLDAASPRDSAAFSVISPERAASLNTLADSAEAKGVLRAAAEALTRPPGPLPVIHTEGTLPGKGVHDTSVQAAKDLPAILSMALAWRLTGDRQYLAGADRYMSAWLSTYRVSLNPIDETRFDALFLAFDLARADLPEKTRAAMLTFARTMAEGYLKPPAKNKGTSVNNWQSHRVKLAALAAFALTDKELEDRAEAAFKAQLAANLRPDGSTLDFEERDALRYVVYGLEPLMLASLAAAQRGRAWFGLASPSGASLGKCLAWLGEYACGERKHDEFTDTRVNFDRERRAAGIPGFKGDWDPKGAKQLYHLAARLDGQYLRTAIVLGRAAPWLAMCFPTD